MLDGLENVEVMLHVVKGFGEVLPTACQNTCQEGWTVLDAFIQKYGSESGLAERVTRVLRHGVSFFGDAALPVAASVVARMSFAFESSGIASYLWIAGKVAQQFGTEEDQYVHQSFLEVYERSTNKVTLLLQSKPAGELPDGELQCCIPKSI